MIKFENVEIKYINDFSCLYNFNATIDSNTLFIGDEFVGSNAIMRILAKVDKHYSGNVFIDETDIKTIKDKDLSIAYIPNKPELFLNKSLYTNLAYPLKIRKFNKNYIKNEVNSAIFKYKLNNFSKKAKSMNLNERKIITLVRAILRKPKYILLEHFFEDLDSDYVDLTTNILADAKEFATIIACEKQNLKLPQFENFKVINLNK